MFERFLLSVEAKYSAIFHLNHSLHTAHLETFMGGSGVNLPSERWHLHNLSVDPRFQGKGVGKMLVDEGKERASREGVCVQLNCGDHNKKWYERRGFTEVAQVADGEMASELGEIGWAMGWEPETISS